MNSSSSPTPGESAVFCDHAWSTLLEADFLARQIDYAGDLEPIFGEWTRLYAATDEMHDAANCPVPADELITTRGIEVGHVFNFGAKYSAPMGAVVSLADGEPVPLEMGSYGVGVSRLVGALIEANHDDAGIIWPASVAPFRVGLINLRAGDARCREAADDLYGKLRGAGVDVLYDDRDNSPGAKFAAMDLIGLPEQLVIGPRGIAAGTVEVKERRSGARREMPIDAAPARFAGG